MPLFGAIEAGGTKFLCAVGTGPDDLKEQARFPTTTPHETLAKCLDFFQAQPKLDAIGVGCFGPLELNQDSANYGRVAVTPKAGWGNADIVGPFEQALGIPVGFDTDVNAAVLGEARWGAAQGLASVVYITVGTGIGGGALIGGRLAHGLVHPEMGHLLVPRELDDQAFQGDCPFHAARCWEGLASGPAMLRRWGQRAETLPADHPAWDLESRYIASALTSVVLVLSPERLILGGGVMQVEALFPLVRKYLVRSLAGYVQADALIRAIDQYVVPPGLGQRSGILGGLALAEQAASEVLAQQRPHDLLHGITLEEIVKTLLERYGWEELGQLIAIRCFQLDPSVSSSLKFLRRTPWARKKVEDLYVLGRPYNP